MVAFDSKSLEKEAILRSIVSSQLVHVSGFPQGTSAEEVKSYMATYGTVVNVVKDVQASEEWDVEFIQTQDLIKVLSVSHVYEDSILQVTAKT